MPDPNSDDQEEDLSINDQETVVELVLEKFLGYEDAIEEHDEKGDEDQNLELAKEFKQYSGSFPSVNFNRPYIQINDRSLENSVPLPCTITDILSPPPKA